MREGPKEQGGRQNRFPGQASGDGRMSIPGEGQWIRGFAAVPVAATKIPIGRGARPFDFLTTYFEWLFDALADIAQFRGRGIVDAAAHAAAHRAGADRAALPGGCRSHGSWRSASLLGLLFIINQGLWKETVQTLVLVVAATALSMAIGVPLGIWAAHKPRSGIMLPVLDLMQTMPTFVYLIPVLILFGLGMRPA
jgi:glycine betaine/proline transport system permease protein